jgi:hypothetical protein
MKAFILFVIIGMCSASCLGAFDFVISDTYEYAVSLHGVEALLVTGGGADQIIAYDRSYVEIRNTRPLQEFVGGVGLLLLNNYASTTFGNGELNSFRIYSDAQAVLGGGRINHISSYQDADDLVQVGWDYDRNVPIFRKHIEMIVREWVYNPQTKLLSGVWNVDNNNDTLFDTFSIQLHNQTGYDPVIDNIKFTIIPEPATLLLFGLGGLLMRRNSVSLRR